MFKQLRSPKGPATHELCCAAMLQVTQLEQNMNILVALMFALQLTLAFLGAIGSHTFYTTRDAGAWYLGRPG